MSTVELGAENFERTVTENEIVFVDFWASWCGPCRQFAPVYEKAALAHPDMVFGKVDTEAEQALAGSGADHLDPDPDGLQERHLGLLPARRAAGRRAGAGHRRRA